MSRTRALQRVSIRDFSLGLNTKTQPIDLQPNEVQDCRNVLFDEKRGLVVKRKGKVLIDTITGDLSPSRLFTFINSAGTVLTIAQLSDYKIYYSADRQTWTQLVPVYSDDTTITFTALCSFAIYEGMLWISNASDDVCIFDGTNGWVLNGGTYAVATYSGSYPTGKSDPWISPDVPKGKYILLWSERVFIVNTADNGSEARFSRFYNDAGADIYCYDSAAWPATNQVAFGQDDGESCGGAVVFRGSLIVFKNTSIYTLRGTSPSYYNVDRLQTSIGCIWHWTIKEYQNTLVFLGNDGVYSFDGNSVLKLSDKIQPTVDTWQSITSEQSSWIHSTTAHWNTGTFGAKLINPASGDIKQLAQTTEADWNAGVATDTTVYEDVVTLSPGSDIALGKTSTAEGYTGIHTTDKAVDGDDTTYWRYSETDNSSTWFYVNLGSTFAVRGYSIKCKAWGYYTTFKIYRADAITDAVVAFLNRPDALPVPDGMALIDGFAVNPNTEATPSQFFSPSNSNYIIVVAQAASGLKPSISINSLRVYSAYKPTGNFVTQSLDYGFTPASLGNLAAHETKPTGTSITYESASSADGTTWDAYVAVANGAAIASTVRRYLKIKATLNADGTYIYTPTLHSINVAGQWQSAVKDLGYVPTAWAQFQVDAELNSQTADLYMRSGTSEANCLAAGWTAVTFNTIPAVTLAKFVQFEFRFNTTLYSQIPVVHAAIINYYKTGLIIQDAQAIVFEDIYYLAVVPQGSTTCDVVVPMKFVNTGNGKNVIFSYFTGLNVCAFAQVGRDLYASSNADGDLFQLFSGYSDAGVAIHAWFQTKDFNLGFPDNQKRIRYLWLNAEQPGNYELSTIWSFDNGVDYDFSVNFEQDGGAFNRRYSFTAGTKGKVVRFMFENTVDAQQMEVKGIELYYKILPLRDVTTSTDSGGGIVPRTWTEATRPTNPYPGQTGYNSDFKATDKSVGDSLWRVTDGEWTTTNRPNTASLAVGSFGWNTTLKVSERWDGSAWEVD